MSRGTGYEEEPMAGRHRPGNRAAFAARIGSALALAAVPSHADDPSKGKLLLVLDSSGSMKGADASGATKIAAAKKALRSVIDHLPDRAQVGLRVYGATVFAKT